MQVPNFPQKLQKFGPEIVVLVQISGPAPCFTLNVATTKNPPHTVFTGVQSAKESEEKLLALGSVLSTHPYTH